MQPPRSIFNIARINRRKFLQGTAGFAGASTLLHLPGFTKAEAADASTAANRSANERLNIAIIGAGGRGGANLAAVGGENIVALCDVYEPAVLKAAQKYPSAKKYSDFRKLFENAKDFDAV